MLTSLLASHAIVYEVYIRKVCSKSMPKSLTLQPSQPLPCIRNLNYPRISVLPELEEFLLLLFLLIHRQVHLSQQFLKSRFVAQGVPIWIDTQIRHVWIALLEALFQPV